MAAREDFAQRKVPVEYVDVKANPAEISRMLGFSGGQRKVPVIVEGNRVTVGFGGS